MGIFSCLKSSEEAEVLKKQSAPAQSALSSSELLINYQDEFVDIIVRTAPLYGPVFNITKYADKLFEFSAAYATFKMERMTKLKNNIQNLNQSTLSLSEIADLEFLKDGETCYDFEIPISHLGLLGQLVMSFQSYQAFETLEDINNYKTRLSKIAEMFDEIIVAYRVGIKKKITLPKESIDIMISQCDAAITDDYANSPYNMNKEKILQITGDSQFLISTIKDNVVPSFKKLKSFLQDEYIHHARSSSGIYDLANSNRVYTDLIYIYTSVHYTPEEIHQMGLNEVDRIWKLMVKTQEQIFPGSSVEEFRLSLKDKSKYPSLYFEKDEDIIQSYKDLLNEIDTKTPKYFRTFPKFRQCQIEAVPKAMEKGTPIAFYRPGTAQKSGIFMANCLLHKESPAIMKTSITLHEANPGHHHQVSLTLEDESKHVIKKMVKVPAFVEGYGLYCEYLGEDGRLEHEMFRALRLVVDTGLHAKGWTVEESVKFMMKYVSMPETKILNDVKRYCIMPAQAVTYKIGEIKIKEIRKFAEEQLDDKFDIIEFHETLLSFGNMSLNGLEKLMKKWVADKKKEQ
ncbi:hypothetical protein HK099_000490 [Clydaea vesicula]|uniref:DUF885 domain-containing protein n=1 Tax=Clydaea vesicula TaxID=447962 RepID=A0AAD5TUP7_9FUNG|nr:hypothetical protein HK099_000490 [Clydaea vesicula]